ncbi:MAG: hypothetical protein LBV50_11215 [Novosphingobium sp.]|jgi:hypothetical protein|nr:hypothetical protein [Novosphingobium sp.]
MARDLSSDPDFLLYCAGVLLREAGARRGTSFAALLLNGAARARREAIALRKVGTVQGELFA